MRVKMIYFSPTGGTKRVARVLADAMGTDCGEIDLANREMREQGLLPDDVAVIAVPSFSGRVVSTAAERLKKVNGNGARAVIMAVYGNRAYEDTLVELADLAVAQGFKVVAAVAAVARHSVVTKIAAERPDSEDMRVLGEFGGRILEKLGAGDEGVAELPGNRPYRKAGKGFAPKTTLKCNECGLCVRECPTGAICAENPRKIDKSVCIGCMRCVAVCRRGAKQLSPVLRFLAGRMLKKPCATRKEPELYL